MEKGTKVKVFKVVSMRAVAVVHDVKINDFMEDVACFSDLMKILVSVSCLRKKRLDNKLTEDP